MYQTRSIRMEKRRIGVRGIIFRDGKLLISMLCKNNEETGRWITPGGGLDPAESLESGLYREMVEETGITPKIGRLLFIQQFSSDRDDRDEELEFFFHIENSEDYEKVDLASATHGFEHSRTEFIDPKTEVILPAFLQTIDIADYIKNQHSVFIWNELA